MNIEVKIFNKILANWIQQYIKGILQHDQVEFIPKVQAWFNIHKSISVIHQIIKTKSKNQMIISIDAKKHLTKFNIHSWLKLSKKLV